MSPRPLLVLYTGTTVPYVRERFGDFQDHFRAGIADAWSGPWATADARDLAAPLPRLGEVAGVFVTGSSSSVTEHTPWMDRLEGWMREVVSSDVPMLGVCFGHQILASALGGEVTQNPRGRHIGTIRIRKLDDDPLFEGVPREFHVNVSHRDHVARPPAGVRPLATADHDSLHAFAASPRVRAVQFHPEFRQEIMRGYIDQRREILRGEGLDPDSLHAGVVEPPDAPTILRNFVRRFVAE